ncbi:MAG: sugar phosphate nucleotidyltransferase [Patescibacteria group bacterium]
MNNTLRGVILAGGTGSRLFPLTRVTNKHLLPIYDKPMIYYPLQTLLACGVEDILIVSGREHAGHFLNLLGSGKDFGVRLSYEVQDEAGGIAQALGLARNFASGERVIVILGDNIFTDLEQVRKAADDFRVQPQGAKVLVKAVPDAERFGVAEVEDGKIISIVEKPKQPKSNLAVTGLYFYDADVFSIIETLQPSHRGELEITDVNAHYVTAGTMTYETVAGEWTDAGTFGSLLRANALMGRQAGLEV